LPNLTPELDIEQTVFDAVISGLSRCSRTSAVIRIERYLRLKMRGRYYFDAKFGGTAEILLFAVTSHVVIYLLCVNPRPDIVDSIFGRGFFYLILIY
jgi:hypothetical protein